MCCCCASLVCHHVCSSFIVVSHVVSNHCGISSALVGENPVCMDHSYAVLGFGTLLVDRVPSAVTADRDRKWDSRFNLDTLLKT